jgi:site-specific DNA-methyltransferase (adenine-specific)
MPAELTLAAQLFSCTLSILTNCLAHVFIRCDALPKGPAADNKDALMISFYGWNRADRFMAAWKNAGFSVVGHLVFAKTYTLKSAYVGYTHECAYVLAKGRPPLPENPLRDVLDWKYTGNKYHPTEKPVSSLQPLIESFTRPGGIVLDPFAGSGSTCVAALQVGRRYIGIELLQQYHRAGVQRLAAVQRSMHLPAANGDWLPEAA